VVLATLIGQIPGALADTVLTDTDGQAVSLMPGHESLKKWRVPSRTPAPENNAITPERIALGEKLFFDSRLSTTGQTTCASCHLPERGWADGFPLSIRFMGERMTRNSPSIMNVAFNTAYMWDGRNQSLEQQATSSQSMTGSLNAGSKDLGITDANAGVDRIGKVKGYVEMFASAYPGEPISKETASKAIATFERSLVSSNTPFDRWVRGDAAAMTPEQVRGFGVFIDPQKGNCGACHSAPNFTDNGFHNVGLKAFGDTNPDLGRYKERPLPLMKGAFRTPPLRDVELTAPYFHDGSVAQLKDVVEHYARGGDVKTNLSPNMKPLILNDGEKADLVAFLRALTSRNELYDYPRLPK
jgi:cytochrome c peroxidase